jgi:hypothetical protein
MLTAAPISRPLAKYVTTRQASAITQTPLSRWQGSYRQNGIATPALLKGEYQVSRGAVIRAAILIDLQRAFGEQSTLPLQVARAISDDDAERLLTHGDPYVPVDHGRSRFSQIPLDPEWLASIREGLAAIPA